MAKKFTQEDLKKDADAAKEALAEMQKALNLFKDATKNGTAAKTELSKESDDD